MLLDATTSPGFPGVPQGMVVRATVYSLFLTIPVVDQCGEPLGAAWAGSAITEFNGVSINQALAADSTYQDPVGPVRGIMPAIQSNDPRAAAWLLAGPLAIGPSSQPQTLAVQVAGHQLNPAVVNRTVNTTMPAAAPGAPAPATSTAPTITVVWP
jgi:hypothetical protein